MHVTLLTNSHWLDEELPALKYLTVGLLDEQVLVAQVVPDTLPTEESSAFGKRLNYEESAWQYLRRRRILALEEPLRELTTSLIHVFDSALWDAGLRLAAELELPALLNVAAADDFEVAEKLHGSIVQQQVAFACATQPLADSISEMFGEETKVELVRSGVHLSRTEQAEVVKDQPLCGVISGGGQLDDDYVALFTAIRDVTTQYPEVQFFLDVGGREEPDLYKAVQHYDLQTNLSLVPHRLGHREMQLSADVIIHPQAQGRSRSMTLQAMANGVPILAKADRWLDYLLHDETAWLVEGAKADLWRTYLTTLIEDPAKGHSLGKRARQWVGKDHLASQQVGNLLTLYREITGEAMKF